jgi:serine/threonine protein kinase
MKTMRMAESDEANTDAILGRLVDGYRIKRKLASGGMGTVYEAVHEKLGRRYAVKILHQHLLNNPQLVARFIAEGQRTNCINIDGVVAVHHIGRTETGLPFLVMDYIDGEPLSSHRQRLFGKKEGRLPRLSRPLRSTPSASVVLNVLRLARQLAHTLSLIHEQGIVHRDLKPDNIFVVRDDCVSGGSRVKILDFGISKVVGRKQAPPSQSFPWAPTIEPTVRGTVLGTPAYMSPEQWYANGIVHPRTDVYACGIIFYELMSGRTPFVSEFIGQLMELHLTQAPTPLAQIEPWVPAAFSDLIDRMLRKNPSERPDMSTVVGELETLVRSYVALVTEPQGAAPGGGGLHTLLDGLMLRQSKLAPQPGARSSSEALPSVAAELVPWRQQRVRLVVLVGFAVTLVTLVLVAQSGHAPAQSAAPAVASEGGEVVVHTEPEGSQVYLLSEREEGLESLLVPRCKMTPCQLTKAELARAERLVITHDRYRGVRLTPEAIRRDNYQILWRLQPLPPERLRIAGPAAGKSSLGTAAQSARLFPRRSPF